MTGTPESLGLAAVRSRLVYSLTAAAGDLRATLEASLPAPVVDAATERLNDVVYVAERFLMDGEAEAWCAELDERALVLYWRGLWIVDDRHGPQPLLNANRQRRLQVADALVVRLGR